MLRGRGLGSPELLDGLLGDEAAPGARIMVKFDAPVDRLAKNVDLGLRVRGF